MSSVLVVEHEKLDITVNMLSVSCDKEQRSRRTIQICEQLQTLKLRFLPVQEHQAAMHHSLSAWKQTADAGLPDIAEPRNEMSREETNGPDDAMDSSGYLDM